MTVVGFWANAEADRERVALIHEDGTSVKAGDLLDRSNQLVHGLREMGLEPGDQLAVVMPNCIEMVELYFAALQAGWRITPINNHLVGPEIAYIVNDSESKVFIGHEEFADTCAAAQRDLEIGADRCFAVGSIDGFSPFADLTDGQPSDAPEGRIAGMAMHYTSGTTGRPKGVKRALVDIDPNVLAELMSGFHSMFGVTAGGDGVHICASPLYHTAPLMWFGTAFHLGHTAILMKKFDGQRFMELIDEHSVTWSHMVPTQFHRILLAVPPDERGKYDVSSLSAMVHAAAPCPPDIKREMIEWWGDAIWEYYAATEGGGTTISAGEWIDKPGSVGTAWAGSEIKILDDDHNEMPTGEPGTVYMSLALADFEYKGDEKKTKDNRWNGFFTVGDYGYLDDDGYLFLMDRKSDMIISGGVNIYPAEIEATMISAPGVDDVAVFGIPHEEWGEEIKAVVQLQDGLEQSEENRQAIVDYLTENLAKFKTPKTIDFIDQLPRDPSGKLFKRKLRDPYWEGKDRQI